MGLLTPYFHLIFITLDLPILEYAKEANVTGLQLNELNNTRTNSIYAEFNLKNVVANKPQFRTLPPQAAFIYDAFLLLATTINLHELEHKIPSSPSVSCVSETPWRYGPEFVNLIRMNDFYGLSGHVKFDPLTGSRTNFSIRIVDLIRDNLSIVISNFIFMFFLS